MASLKNPEALLYVGIPMVTSGNLLFAILFPCQINPGVATLGVWKPVRHDFSEPVQEYRRQ